MTGWRFILITIVLMKTKDSRAINGKVSPDNLSPRYNESMEMEKRLPEDVVPRKYVIAISPDFRKDDFHGSVRIDLELLKDRSYIALHSKDLTVTSTKLFAKKSQTEVRILSTFYVSKREMLVIKTYRNISVGQYFLKMNFSGSLKGKMSGFYLSTYTDNNRSVRKLAVSQFEPFYARTAFPCFDEPSFKSIFEIHLLYPRNFLYHAQSNMPIAKVENVKEDWEKAIAYFDPSPPMSTYLVAFLVSDFECLGSSVDLLNGSKVPIAVCARGAFKPKVTFALNITVRIMRHYLEKFQIDYPLPKLDLVAIPDFSAGAMENWGLVAFRETELLHSENSSCVNMKSVSLTVAHELAHMWFGNLVTMKWWDDLWLNEGFATYMEHVAVDSLFPDWHLMDSFPLYTKYVSMKADIKLRARAIVRRIEDPNEIEETFDRISYQKAAAVIRMLEDAVGNSKFISAVRKYLRKYQFRNAESRDLFDIFGNSTMAAVDVADFVDRWLRFPGFPVINVRRDNAGFQLSRRRFATSRRFRETIDDGSWTIPIRYETSRKDGIKLDWFLANFSCVELSLEKSVDWMKLNHDSIGYYIVNYTEDAWDTFGRLLFHDHLALSAMNRADLLHDAFLLAETHLDYSIVMNLTSYLMNEDAYQPWVVAMEWFGQMNRLLEGTIVLPRFQSYARNLVNSVYRQVGWRIYEKDSFRDREFRVLILTAACSVGHPHCLESAGRRLRKLLLDDSEETSSADIRSIVYSFGLVTLSDDVGSMFEKMSRLLEMQDDAEERERLMLGMTGVPDKDILNRYLERATDETFIRKQDFAELLIKIAMNPVGLDVAWNFVRSRWRALLVMYESNQYVLGKIVCSIVCLFKDRQKLQEARQFFLKEPELRLTENAKSNAIEEIENSMDWLDANTRSIDEWLMSNGYD
ncbi:PREDICTED: glutamyl aminopeptidase-like [Eufriesea mexicana]|uniref:glutamyl aminopeptidase-like n=1 Tax=Eufriesea mexicana TaxID=516756 RepID=UPI00083C59AC|nr:PREDICTED: glutamyl aminopeptidase-like [Eufriesea mexicana]